METSKNKVNKATLRKKEISAKEIWNSNKINNVKDFILAESKKQTPERKLRNELLAIKYQMQDYIENDTIQKEMQILDFVKLYLKLLKITQRQLAFAFEMKDSNLHKYLKGDRKLNPDLVLKLSYFSHTQPELWYYIQTKNEIVDLRKEKEKIKKYEKYDCINIIAAH